MTATKELTISGLLVPYKERIEREIEKALRDMGEETPLLKACRYALLNGGKRFRPALVYMMAEALDPAAKADEAALAVEFFHTASLIADDLPCMDNDAERRENPSLHIAFDEATALLASYALISCGYAQLAKNSRLCPLALENCAYNTGIFGATGGQLLDLSPAEISETALLETIHKKTTSLFEISFVLGWLYGGGEADALPEVKRTAASFGLAFQIIDDLGDLAQDAAQGHQGNFASFLGEEEAKRRARRELAFFKEKLKSLNLNAEPLFSIAALLERRL